MMDSNQTKNKDLDKNQGNYKDEKQNTEEKTAKITITNDAEVVLDSMMEQVNKGYAGGRVNRQDLASWIVKYFARACFQECVSDIREDHFDQLAYLESVLKEAKKARREGVALPDFSGLLKNSTSSASASSKKRRAASKGEGSQETLLISEK